MKTQVKGTAVLGTIRFVRETFGEEGLAKVKSHLSPEDQQRMDDVVLSSAWYPVSFLLAVMRATRQEFGAGMPDIVAQMGRASADYAHTTVYKFVFKVGSPQWIISKASVIFSSFYDQGQMVVTEKGPRFANVEVRSSASPPQSSANASPAGSSAPSSSPAPRMFSSPTSSASARATRSAGSRAPGTEATDWREKGCRSSVAGLRSKTDDR